MSLSEAQDPTTPAERLQALSRSIDNRIKAALTLNPSTPTTTLLALAAHYPNEFIQNPVLPLLSLENPAFVQSIPHGTLLCLLQADQLPEWIMEGMASHLYAYLLARSPRAPHYLLALLAKHPQVHTRSSVAQNPNTPIPLLEKLAKDKSYEVRACVAQNKKVPAPLVERLSKDKHQQVRQEAARTTIPEILERLSNDKTARVRKTIAYNRSTPAALLEKLALDREEEVLEEVAANPNTPPDSLRSLAVHWRYKIRGLVAKNPSTPRSVLLRLAVDKDRRVFQVAVQQIEKK